MGNSVGGGGATGVGPPTLPAGLAGRSAWSATLRWPSFRSPAGLGGSGLARCFRPEDSPFAVRPGVLVVDQPPRAGNRTPSPVSARRLAVRP